MKSLSILVLLMSSSLLSASHPVMILLLILAQTFLTCVLSWSMIKTPWLSFILFIIFLGGLMVLFVYITSLASNEKFDLTLPSMQTNLSLALVVVVMIMLMKPLNSLNYGPSFNFHKMVSVLISSSNFYIIMTIMTYLLITLIVAVKISNKFEGPLRNMN